MSLSAKPSGSTLVLASSTPVLPSKTNRVAIVRSDLHRPALKTQSPEQGGGCRCLPNLLDRLWFSLHLLRSCPPKQIAWRLSDRIFIDQHSKRSHPNKAVDVVVCQTFWIDSGSRFIYSGPALQNKSRGDCPLAFGLFSLPPGRLSCRRDRCRHRVAQRLVPLSTHPQSVEQHRQLPGHRYRRSLLRILPTTLAELQPISS